MLRIYGARLAKNVRRKAPHTTAIMLQPNFAKQGAIHSGSAAREDTCPGRALFPRDALQRLQEHDSTSSWDTRSHSATSTCFPRRDTDTNVPVRHFPASLGTLKLQIARCGAHNMGSSPGLQARRYIAAELSLAMTCGFMLFPKTRSAPPHQDACLQHVRASRHLFETTAMANMICCTWLWTNAQQTM